MQKILVSAFIFFCI